MGLEVWPWMIAEGEEGTVEIERRWGPEAASKKSDATFYVMGQAPFQIFHKKKPGPYSGFSEDNFPRDIELGHGHS